MSQPVRLLGTTLEGGGQLLRIALGLSALTKTAIHITKIRGSRQGAKGLKQQHLTCVKWLSQASNAENSGAEKKSLELDFRPSVLEENLHFEELIDIGSPGSVSLLIQAILPFLLFSPSPNQGPRRITIKGGINVDLSPSHEYIQHVLVPMLKLIGLPLLEVSLGKRDWTQKNQATGSVSYTIQPLSRGTTLPAFTLSNRESLSQIHAIIIAPFRYQSELQHLIQSTIEEYIKLGHLARPSEEFPVNFTMETPGSTKTVYLLLVAQTATGHRLGRDRYLTKLHSSSTASSQKASAKRPSIAKGRGKPRRSEGGSQADDSITTEALSALAENVVGDLADELKHGGCVDTFMRDQLVVYQALAKGKSYVDGGREEGGEEELEGRPRQASLHAQTAEWVCRELLGRFGCHFDGHGSCEGIGWVVGEGKRDSEREVNRNVLEREELSKEVEVSAESLEGTHLS